MAVVSARLVQGDRSHFDAVFESCLGDMGTFAEADRAYVFLFASHEGTMRYAYEWCNKGVAAQKGTLSTLPIDTFPWWLDQLQHNRALYIADVELLPPEAATEKAILQLQSVRSLIAYPMLDDYSRLQGFIGFDYLQLMSEENLQRFELVLKILAEISSRAISKNMIELELERSRDQFRSLVKNVPGFFYRRLLDTVLTPVYLSEGFERLTGFSREKFLGDGDLCIADQVHHEDRNAVVASIWSAQQRSESWSLQYRLRTAKGLWIWVQENGRGVTDADGSTGYIEGFVFDITDRKRAEEHLRLQAVALQATSDGALITDRSGKILWANNAFVEMSGYTLDELLQQTPSVLKSGFHDESFYQRLWDDILAKKAWKGEVVNRHKDGHVYAAETTITPVLDDHGRITHFVAIKRELSDRNLLLEEIGAIEQRIHSNGVSPQKGSVTGENQLGRLYEALLTLRQAQKLEAIGQLAAGIAHEINNPVQFIHNNIHFLRDALESFAQLAAGFEALLEEARLTPSQRVLMLELREIHEVDYFNTEIPMVMNQTLSGLKRVTDIVQAMKDFSHPGSKERDYLDLNQSIREAVDIARNEFKYHSEVQLELDDLLPQIFCYRAELNQVILNLLINAAHAVGEAVDKGLIERGVIVIYSRRDGDKAVRLSVKDNGIGIAKEHQERVFEPFFTTKEAGKGTGQGLPFAYDVVVRRHHGKLNFSSKAGRGAEFTVILPLEDLSITTG